MMQHRKNCVVTLMAQLFIGVQYVKVSNHPEHTIVGIVICSLYSILSRKGFNREHRWLCVNALSSLLFVPAVILKNKRCCSPSSFFLFFSLSRICQRCIKRMDHHCMFVNNCVGQNNQKYFILFTVRTCFINSIRSMHYRRNLVS